MTSSTVLKKRSLEIIILVIVSVLLVACVVAIIVLAILYQKEKESHQTQKQSCATSDGITVCCQPDEVLVYRNNKYSCDTKNSS